MVVYTLFTLKASIAQGDCIQFSVRIHYQKDQKRSPVIPEQFRMVCRYANIEMLLFDMRDSLCKLEVNQPNLRLLGRNSEFCSSVLSLV